MRDVKVTIVTLALLAVSCADPESGSATSDSTPASAQDSKQSARAGADADPVAGERALADRRYADAVKNPNYERQRRFSELSNRLAPEQRALREALDNGEWQSVLEKADALEALWAVSGEFQVKYPIQRAEAHIGLGHPEEAISLIDPDPGHRDTPANLTLALALAMTDQLDTQSAVAIANSSVTYMSGIPAGFVQPPVTRNQKIAVVRMARAIDASSSARDAVALREAKEALRLDPSLPLAAYVAASVLSRMHRSDEALPYWRQASSLPGQTGKQARDMATSTEAVIRQQAQSAQSGQGAGGGSQ